MHKEPTPPAEWVNPNKPKKKSRKNWGIGILVLSLVLLAGAGGYLIKSGRLPVFQNKSGDSEALSAAESADMQPQAEMQAAASERTEEGAAEELQTEELLKEPESETEPESAPEQETGQEAEQETGRENGQENRRKAEQETGRETGQENRQEAEQETGREAERETGRETEQETGRETGQETERQYGEEETSVQAETSLEFEQGSYTLTEEEAYFINVMAAYGWEQTGGKEGSFKAAQEELLAENIDFEMGAAASQVVHAQMLAEGLFCEGIILERAGTDSHCLYSRPYYFSVLLTYEGEIICTYEEFKNHVTETAATSELTDDYGTYPADYAIDGNSATAWAVGGEERTGEAVTLMLDRERTIYGVLILNGYWKSEAAYKNNGIVTAFDIYTGSDWQTYAYGYKENYLREITERQAYDVAGVFYDSVTADRVTIKISGVENGEKYTDVCVSEIMVLAR